jgi:hypothetical protein
LELVNDKIDTIEQNSRRIYPRNQRYFMDKNRWE